MSSRQPVATDSRRQTIARIAMIGLETTLLTPLIIWLYRGSRPISPMALLALLWGLATLWSTLVDLLGRLAGDERSYRRAVFAALLISSWFLLRALLYGHIPPGDLSWIRPAWRGLFNFNRRVPAELLLILTNLLLWQRALRGRLHGLHFLNLSAKVRILWVLTVAAGLLATTGSTATLMPAVLVSFPIGLLLLILERIEDRASAVTTRGRSLAWRHVAQFFLVILMIVGIGLAPQLIPPGLPKRWTEAVLSFVLFISLQVIIGLVFLLYPLILESIQLVIDLLGIGEAKPQTGLPPIELPEQQLDGPVVSRVLELPPWAIDAFRFAALLLLIAGAALIVALAVRTIRPRKRRRYQEDETHQRTRGSDALLGQGLQSLREMMAMARQIGLNQELMAAISVQNIYANLVRLATKRGYPREKHRPPDLYLKDLVAAFGGHAEPLRRITDAYMCVHYGDRSLTRGELKQVQTDYRLIREAIA